MVGVNAYLAEIHDQSFCRLEEAADWSVERASEVNRIHSWTIGGAVRPSQEMPLLFRRVTRMAGTLPRRAGDGDVRKSSRRRRFGQPHHVVGDPVGVPAFERMVGRAQSRASALHREHRRCAPAGVAPAAGARPRCSNGPLGAARREQACGSGFLSVCRLAVAPLIPSLRSPPRSAVVLVWRTPIRARLRRGADVQEGRCTFFRFCFRVHIRLCLPIFHACSCHQGCQEYRCCTPLGIRRLLIGGLISDGCSAGLWRTIVCPYHLSVCQNDYPRSPECPDDRCFGQGPEASDDSADLADSGGEAS